MQISNNELNGKTTVIGIAIFAFWAIFLSIIAPLMGATPLYTQFYLEMSLVGIVVLFRPINPMISMVQGLLLVVIKILFWMNTNIWTTALTLFVGLSMVIMGIFKVFKLRKIRKEEIGFITSSNQDMHPLATSPMWLRLAIPGIFTVAITLSVMISGTIIVPVPSAFGFTAAQMSEFNETLSTQPQTDTFLSSVPVGFVEDMFTLAIVVTFIHWFRFFAFDVLNMNPSMVFNLIFTVIALLIGAWAFSSAHYTNPNYISNPVAAQSAFVFCVINIGIMLFTGIFLPLPHIAHNAIAVSTLYNAMALPFLLVPIAQYFGVFALPKRLFLNKRAGIFTQKTLIIFGLIAAMVLVALFGIGGLPFSIQTGSPSSYCTLTGDTYISNYCSGTTLWVKCDRDGSIVWKSVSCHTLCGCTICGDGYCDTANGEFYSNCPADCNPPTNPGYCSDSCSVVGSTTCDLHHVDPSIGEIQYECFVSAECSNPFWNYMGACKLGCCNDVCCENKYSGSLSVYIGSIEVRM